MCFPKMSAQYHLIMVVLTVYIIIASVGCVPSAVAAHESLKFVGIESKIAVASVDGKETYGHAFIIIGDNCYEPRYLGLHLQSNIDYKHPYKRYNTTSSFLTEKPLSRIPRTILLAILENVNNRE